MFKEIFLFEIRYRLKRVSTYVYFFLWLLMGFLYMSVDVLRIGDIGAKVLKNSAYSVSFTSTVLMAFGVMITSSLAGTAIYRDFEYNTYPLFFTAPIKKSSYLGARLLASLLLAMIVFSGIGTGMMLGSFMPWIAADKVLPFRLANYVQPFLLLVVPNVFFTGALFFLVGTLTRSLLAVYLQGVAFFAVYLISEILLGDIDNEFIPALFDPFAINAAAYMTKYWTIAEKNSLLIPLSDVMLYNRLFWTGMGVLSIAAVFHFFKFSTEGLSTKPSRLLKPFSWAKELSGRIVGGVVSLFTLPFDLHGKTAQFASLTRFHFFAIVKEISFWAIMLIGMVILLINGSQAGKIYDTPTYPVTYAVLELISGTFQLFFLIIITVYSGELVWKERGVKFDQIYDAFPLPGYVTFLSRFTALTLLQLILIAMLIVTGILIQVYNGYFNFELSLYFKHYFGLILPGLLQLIALSLLVQTLLKNKFSGHAVMVLFYIVGLFINQLGYQHKIYQYGDGPGYIYSAMNGYGHFVQPLITFNVYWTVCAGLIAILAIIFINRGTDSDWGSRFKQARLDFNMPLKALSALFLSCFIGIGGFIYYNTNVLNKYRDTDDFEALQIDYEKKYKQYEKLPQPRIVATKVQVDLFPETRSFNAKGSYTLRNKTDKDIDAIHILLPDDSVKSLTFDRANKEELKDDQLGYRIYKLTEPLKPGAEMKLDFEMNYVTKGFRNNGEQNEIAANGTFFNNASFFPGIGYKDDQELSDDDKRKKRGLPAKPDLPPPTDMNARMNTYISNDADWMTFEAIVSTSPDQIAIAPGYLQREWTENNRRYFEYKMGDTKILNFFSIMSGNYEVKRDKWNDVNIEIYYHKEHAFNLDRMIDATKKGLDYFSKSFSPYQHKQFRIIEFPRYASFAQSFPNTIPYSESIGFIARINSDEDIDYPFYITAHELAHQWWAHQVIGGNVQGSPMLSETFSQYSALMLMEKEFGKDNIRKFLREELNDYLRGRSRERKKELPLALVEGQAYIYYQKGSVVMYALKDYIGEEKLNEAISKYLKSVAYQEPPYTSSLEFIKVLRESVPAEQQYLIEDLFETITLFENRAIEASYRKTEDGKYLVKVIINAKKYRAEGTGEEREITINDMIDIGVFNGDKKKEKVLHMQKYKITQPEMEFEIKVDEEPKRAGIDPYNKLIDRKAEDNVIDVKSAQ